MQKWHEDAVRELLRAVVWRAESNERAHLTSAEAKMLLAAFEELMPERAEEDGSSEGSEA